MQRVGIPGAWLVQDVGTSVQQVAPVPGWICSPHRAFEIGPSAEPDEHMHCN